jgi:DNA-binding MarR family transcriptional regulator
MNRIFRSSSLKDRLLATIRQKGGEYRGIRTLAEEVERDQGTVKNSLQRLEAEGQIVIIPGAPGRGNGAIIQVQA